MTSSNGVLSHNGPSLFAGGYLQITGALFNPPESIIPKLGTGVELLYVKDNPNPAAANGYGLLQGYSRDTNTYRDLYITGRNVTIGVNGGKLALPANSVQYLVGYARATSSYTIPAAGWGETDVQFSPSWSGATARIEWEVNMLSGPGVGTVHHVGLGIDGALTWPSIGAYSSPGSGYVVRLSGVLYNQAPTTGVHRIAIWIYGPAGAGLWNGAYSSLAVTEQRA